MKHTTESAIFCCDIGSVRRAAFGWARTIGDGPVEGGRDIDACADHIRRALDRGMRVALGIEAPLFLPVPPDRAGLSLGRTGERDRSCFAPSGGYVATLGIHELAYLLQCISGTVTLDWGVWAEGKANLLIWEAFVSGAAHTDIGDHVADAATAVVEFRSRIATGELSSDVSIEEPRRVLSLAGTALLWSGLAADLAILSQATIVVKPTVPYLGAVSPIAE